MDGSSKYPRMRWDPETGQRHLVAKASEDDPKFISHHPEDPDAKRKARIAAAVEAAEEPADKPAEDLSDDEVVAALKAGKVKFADDADAAALRQTLRDSLATAMEGKSLPVEDGMSLRDMLAAVTG